MRNMIAMFLFIALVAALYYILTSPPPVASWGAIHGTYIPPEQPRGRE